MVKDIHPNGSSAPESLTDVNGTLFFIANDGTHGRELWKTDGTEAGTVLVRDINPGAGAVFNLTDPQLANLDGLLVFGAIDGPSGAAHGQELWRSDGTEAGTVLVKDNLPGVASGSVSSLTVMGGDAFYTSTSIHETTGLNDSELWRTDGTAAGTQRVRDIHPTGSSIPGHLTASGGVLYFVAQDAVNGRELWKSDGTETGTFMVADQEWGLPHSRSAGQGGPARARGYPAPTSLALPRFGLDGLAPLLRAV
jgi:ELWxxDGT repeat protein